MRHLRLNTKEFQNLMEGYILSRIGSEDKELTTPAEKLEYAYKSFLSECWTEYEQQRHAGNKINGFADYLKGLPSSIEVDYMNYRILEIAKTFNTYKDTTGMSEKQIDKYESFIIENWWNVVSINFFRLLNKYSQLN